MQHAHDDEFVFVMRVVHGVCSLECHPQPGRELIPRCAGLRKFSSGAQAIPILSTKRVAVTADASAAT